MKNGTFLIFLSGLLFSGCIGDDIVFDTIEQSVRITNPIDSLEIGQTYQFEAQFFNNIGMQESADVVWTTSQSNIVGIDATGLATAKAEGTVTITASVIPPVGDQVEASLSLVASAEQTNNDGTTRSGSLQSTSSYTLSGDFSLQHNTTGTLELALADNFRASSSLPGLYVYLTNNPNTNNNALEIGPITQFTGAHTYTVPGSSTELGTYNYVLFYCKPFSVKVGDGEFDN
ncbi:MAG: hypothetical protein DHS20C18_25270 [Saprospiraceae bacterium]|nr:MAG: hypothetical protein DHS20C18_25270 [Saprospiraceae bacterium]